MRPTIEYDPSFTLLTLELDPGEVIKAEPGAMVAQEGVDMTTGMGGGGIMGGLKRMMGGESFSVNTFTAQRGGGWVSLAPSAPGDIASFHLDPGKNLFVQGGSYMASTENVETDTQFQGLKGLFSGESMFFLRTFSRGGSGTVYVTSYGAIKQVPVHPGKELVVDTGHLVAFSDDVEYSVGKVGGIRSLIAGGEGLVMKFRGSGNVWIQTRNIQSLASLIIPFLPTQRSN